MYSDQIDHGKLAKPLAVFDEGSSVVAPPSGLLIERVVSGDLVQFVPTDLLAETKRRIGRDDQDREAWVQVCANKALAEAITRKAILIRREAAGKTGTEILRLDGSNGLQALLREACAQTAGVEVLLSGLGAVSDITAIKLWCDPLVIGLVLHCDHGEDRTWEGVDACTFADMAIISMPPKSITPVAAPVFIAGFDPELEEIVHQLLTGQRELALDPPGPLTAVQQEGLLVVNAVLNRYCSPWREAEFCPQTGLAMKFDAATAVPGDLAWRGFPAPAFLEAVAAELRVSARSRAGRHSDTVTHEIHLKDLDPDGVRAFLTAESKVGGNVRDARFRAWAFRR